MSLENDILIDNYLRGLLDDSQKADFELRLESDVEFRKDFEIEQALWLSQSETDWSFSGNNDEVEAYKKLLAEDDLQNLKKSIETVNSEFKDVKSINNSKFKFYYLVAASVAILICLNIFIKNDLSNQDLVNNYLNTSDLPSFVSRGSSENNALVKAEEFFKAENYQQALEIFVPAYESNIDNASIYLYTGITQMKLKKFADAESTFSQLIGSDLLDAQKGYWYKALLYLEQDKIEDSKIVLNKIISASLFNHDKAQKLLNKIANE